MANRTSENIYIRVVTSKDKELAFHLRDIINLDDDETVNSVELTSHDKIMEAKGAE